METNIGVLKALGLTEYEGKSLLALLAYGSLSAREVAKRASIPVAPVYETLRSLEKKGLVAKVQEEPLTYEPLDPKVSIPGFVASQKQRLDSIEEESLRLLSDVKPAKESGVAGKEYIRVYFGSQYRFAAGLPLYALARKEIFCLTRSEALPVENFREIKKAIERGVDCKLIATQYDDENKKVVGKYLELGAKVRLNTKLRGYHLLLFDRKIALMILFNPLNSEDLTAVVLENPGLCKMLGEYLEQVWKNSEPVSLRS
jgi:sugar-specific transcriptional regulator TrmB